MAFAGRSEWVVQIFGRWRSAAVLTYVFEALLQRSGGRIAQITEGAPAESLPRNPWELKVILDEAMAKGARSKEDDGIRTWVMSMVIKVQPTDPTDATATRDKLTENRDIEENADR